MSQSVKEFVRQSGVDVQSSDSNSNNNFAQELEADMFRRQREQDREARMRAAGFREPLRPELIQRPQRLQRPLPGPRALPPPTRLERLPPSAAAETSRQGAQTLRSKQGCRQPQLPNVEHAL